MLILNAYILPLLALVCLFAALAYSIVHTRHHHEMNMMSPVTQIKARMTDMIYVDRQHSDVLEVIFRTVNDQTLKFFIDKEEIESPVSDESGLLSYQGDEFRNFKIF